MHNTDEGAQSMPLNAPLIKKWCDVAGTPLPFQRKYGIQETMIVTWAVFIFGSISI